MEQFFYENRPMIYGLISFYALFISKNSALMIISGLVLLYCSARVYFLRYQYKKVLHIQDLQFKLNKQKLS